MDSIILANGKINPGNEKTTAIISWMFAGYNLTDTILNITQDKIIIYTSERKSNPAITQSLSSTISLNTPTPRSTISHLFKKALKIQKTSIKSGISSTPEFLTLKSVSSSRTLEWELLCKSLKNTSNKNSTLPSISPISSTSVLLLRAKRILTILKDLPWSLLTSYQNSSKKSKLALMTEVQSNTRNLLIK